MSSSLVSTEDITFMKNVCSPEDFYNYLLANIQNLPIDDAKRFLKPNDFDNYLFITKYSKKLAILENIPIKHNLKIYFYYCNDCYLSKLNAYVICKYKNFDAIKFLNNHWSIIKSPPFSTTAVYLNLHDSIIPFDQFLLFTNSKTKKLDLGNNNFKINIYQTIVFTANKSLNNIYSNRSTLDKIFRPFNSIIISKNMNNCFNLNRKITLN